MHHQAELHHILKIDSLAHETLQRVGNKDKLVDMAMDLTRAC